jgi:methionine-rich copper-binding protein CopC
MPKDHFWVARSGFKKLTLDHGPGFTLSNKVYIFLSLEQLSMKKLVLIGSVLSLVVTGTALAHTKLTSSMPAEGSTVASAPTEFVLTFGEAARLTALSVQKDGGTEQKIAALPTAAAAQLKVPAPKLESGHYTLSWRVAGDDGHVMNGKVTFSVGGTPSPGAAPASSHADHH